MEIEFTLQKSDLMEYAITVRGWTNQLAQSKVRIALWIWMAGSAIAVILGIFVADQSFLPPMVTYIGIALTLLLYKKVYVKRFSDVYYSEQFFPDSFAPQKLILGERALIVIGRTSKSEFEWNSFAHIVHTPTQTFILLPSRTGFMVPRRIFQSQAAFELFREELESKWQKGKSASNDASK